MVSLLVPDSVLLTIYDKTDYANSNNFLKLAIKCNGVQQRNANLRLIGADGSAVFAGTVTAANFNIDALQVLP